MTDEKERSAVKSDEPIGVYHVLSAMIEQMGQVAWQKMGLLPDPVLGKIEKDISQAKVAIDVTKELVRFLEPELDEIDKVEIQNMLRDLKMNFVQHSQK